MTRQRILFVLLVVVAGAAARYRDCASDILFIMDQSTSIERSAFKQQKQFVKDVIDKFDVGEDKTRVGLITFSDDARLVFSLKRFYEKEPIFTSVDYVVQKGGSTNTGKAMRKARTHALITKFGARLDSPISQIIIVITDGNSQLKEVTKEESRLTRETGVTIFAIGVGKNVSRDELENIASGSEYIFPVESYDALNSIKETLGNVACNVKLTSPPENVIPNCEEKRMDIAVVLDKSSSVSDHDFYEMKALGRSMLYSLDVESNLTKVAVLSYSDSSKIHNHFNQVEQRGKLSNMIRDIKQAPGQSNTAGAFKALRSIFNPRFGARTQVAKVALFITNTRSSEYDVAIAEAENLYIKYGVEIFAVAVGADVDMKEWKSLTGGQALRQSSYEDLTEMTFRNDVAKRLCQVKPPPQDFPCGERNPADIAFALDTLNAGANGLSSINSFAREVASKFEIGPGKIQISMVENDCHQIHAFDLNTYANKTDMLSAMNVDIEMKTVSILNKLVNETFTVAKGAREIGSGAKRFVVLFMDGTPGNQLEVELAANEARTRGQIEIFVIGIGGKVRRPSLEQIASSPKHVFMVKSYGDLVGHGSASGAISDAICKIRVKRTFVRSL